MNKLFSFLKSRDIIGPNGPRAKRLSGLSLTKFVDIIEEIENIVAEASKPVNDPIFSHSASFGLGGSASYCRYVGCRLERINKLARFALMYSDKVYISSFFSEYKDISQDDLEDSLSCFYDDLIILFTIRGAIEHGLIQFFPLNTDTCFTCQAESFLDKKSAAKFDKSYSNLKYEYLDNMQVSCENTYGTYDFICKGPAPYFDHGKTFTRDSLDPDILKQQKIVKSIEAGRLVKIPKSLIKKTQLHIECAHDAAQNAIYGLATSKCLNTTFLTESDLHIKLLNSLHHEKSLTKKNDMAYEHMTSIVPFMEEISLVDLMKLRHRAEEAFLVYRQALKQAIGNFVNHHGPLTKQDAKAMYLDIVAPRLAELDKKVKIAKRDLIKKPFRSLVGVVGSISFGLLTGIVPPNISSIASTIGLVKFGSDFIKDAMAVGDKETKIEDHQFYFLWKVRQKVR